MYRKSFVVRLLAVFAFILSLFVLQVNCKAQQQQHSKKVLVVYFSISGNTEKIAKMVQKSLNADILRIYTVQNYPDDYEKLTEVGHKEVDEQICPELRPISVDISSYDVVVIGSPTWWFTVAPAVVTFLKKYDFSKKIVCFFMTNGASSGEGIKTMRSYCRGDDIEFGPELVIRFAYPANGKIKTTDADINRWIEQIKAI